MDKCQQKNDSEKSVSDIDNITRLLKEQVKARKKINEDMFTMYIVVIITFLISISASVTSVLFTYLKAH